jgi:hypothetical protein
MVRRRPAIRPRRATIIPRVTAAITPTVRGTVITVRTATARIGGGGGGERQPFGLKRPACLSGYRKRLFPVLIGILSDIAVTDMESFLASISCHSGCNNRMSSAVSDLLDFIGPARFCDGAG